MYTSNPIPTTNPPYGKYIRSEGLSAANTNVDRWVSQHFYANKNFYWLWYFPKAFNNKTV